MSAPAVSADELARLHQQLDTLALLAPESLTELRVVVDAIIRQALRRVARHCPEKDR